MDEEFATFFTRKCAPVETCHCILAAPFRNQWGNQKSAMSIRKLSIVKSTDPTATKWWYICVRRGVWTTTHLSIDQSINWSINGQKKLRRDTSVEQHTSGCITWTIYQRRRGDPYWQTQIEGWRGRVVSISNQRYQYSLIDQSVNQLVYQRTYETDGGTPQ